MSEDVLQTPLQYLKGVGPRKAADLKKAGLHTVEDLLFRFPMRYEDRSRLQPIIGLKPGQMAAVSGEVLHCHVQHTRRANFRLFTALVQDASGQIQVVWPNQAFLKDVIRPHQHVVLFGKVELWGSRGLQITDPEFETVDEPARPSARSDATGEPAAGAVAVPLHTGRIVPVYERTGSVTTHMQRRFVWQALEQLPEDLFDPVPTEILAAHGWPSRRTALVQAHFPDAHAPVDALNRFDTPAQRRLIFEDFFVFQAGLALRRHENAQVRKWRVPVVTDATRAAARAVLPFKLTDGQREALGEIVADMQRAWPMQRLLQGDVGAGKTIVAVLAAIVAMENGYQVALMAPTEILAEQHFRTVMRWLEGTRYRVRLLTGRVTAAQRRDLLPAIARGEIQLVIGTHALVQEHVVFRDLALVVIDEQHRFGVIQRGALAAKGGNPDVLVMTATPIPRTLALTECGDMDVSVIRGLPPGRKPVKTIVKPDARRDEVYALIRAEVALGRQAYIVYPLVEESEKVDLRAATAMAEELTSVFPEFRVALLHGRMKGDEKDAVMRAFAGGTLHVLVATSVVEVGVDVPNASVMVVEHAERFGLSQLHQLRGRIGRGTHESTCVLVYQAPWSDDARERLRAMASSHDGFVIAEKDLQIRGPGDFFGTRQSGLPQLRAGDLTRDAALLELAFSEARARVEGGRLTPAVQAYVRSVWQRQFGLITVG
ncbi:MAG TPA: ATP-dependent DNA helicase RecG [Vicinamibacterales bacterium]|nr:ATP-dependent DNA helicase RecG [Vicinamibacterales bacterium]